MYTRCPGQDGRNLRVELYKCPGCGAEVEIFSDEIKVKCQKCGGKVYGRRYLRVSNGAPRRASVWVRKGGGN